MIYKIFVQASTLMVRGDICEEYVDKLATFPWKYKNFFLLYSVEENDCEQRTRIRKKLEDNYKKVNEIDYENIKDAMLKIREEAEKIEYYYDDYLKRYDMDKEEEVRFVVIAEGELGERAWTHTVKETFQYASFSKAVEWALDEGFWCERPQIERHAVADSPIKKVIFLDIDGVLNTDDRENPEFELINEEFVQNLAYIVYKTKAQIVLSSSWRYAIDNSFSLFKEEKFEGLKILLDLFSKYGIAIAGMTPLCFNGPNGRPFEIRQWLSDKADVDAFVILDDETFWKWNWLQDRVVCTSDIYFDNSGHHRLKCGLTREKAEKAVEILTH